MRSDRSRDRSLPIVLSLLLTTGGVACSSHSPFSRSPSDVAIDDPCRFMGTFHKESRVKIEELREQHTISGKEWLCMARSLETLDVHFTRKCRTQSVSFDEISEEQHVRYRSCLAPERQSLAECAALRPQSSDPPPHCP